MPEKKNESEKNLRRWLSSWPVYIFVSQVLLDIVLFTMFFWPLSLPRYLKQEVGLIWKFWCCFQYVHLQPLLARQWVLLAGVVAETWLGSGAGGVLEVHDLPPDFLTWERTCDLPGTLPWTAIPLNSSSHPGKLKKEKKSEILVSISNSLTWRGPWDSWKSRGLASSAAQTQPQASEIFYRKGLVFQHSSAQAAFLLSQHSEK